MRSAENIKRTIENAKIKINPEVKKAALNQLINELEETKSINPVKFKPGIGRIIMNSKITKLAAAAIIVIVVLIGINQFSANSVAFADVIGYFQKHSYTFELDGLTTKPIHAEVWELGRIRVDFPPAVEVGEMSSITDFNTGQTLVLFHKDKTAVMKNEPVYKSVGTEGIISLCTRPIAELWNVLNGSEKYLGEKEIDGKRLSGFRIVKTDQDYKYEITLWADYRKGFPYIVETIATPLDESAITITTTMKNFNVDAQLDENLFSLELPQGYAFTLQENLDDNEVETKLTPEAEKIIQILNMASDGSNEKAIEALLNIDWTKPIEFGKEPYIFSVSEKEFKALNANDQKRVDEDSATTQAAIQNISKEILALGQKAVSENSYNNAEKYFVAGLQLGKLLGENNNTRIVPHIVGLNIEKKVLNEMIQLYTTTNNNEKLLDAQNQLKIIEEEIDRIRQESKETQE